jgi:hypothetical protein
LVDSLWLKPQNSSEVLYLYMFSQWLLWVEIIELCISSGANVHANQWWTLHTILGGHLGCQPGSEISVSNRDTRIQCLVSPWESSIPILYPGYHYNLSHPMFHCYKLQ